MKQQKKKFKDYALKSLQKEEAKWKNCYICFKEGKVHLESSKCLALIDYAMRHSGAAEQPLMDGCRRIKVQ